MTPKQVRDLEMIRQRLAACTQAGDARKADAYAGCFTKDGVLALDPAIEGREAICAWMKAPSVIPQSRDGTAGFISHHLTTCHVDFTGPDTATARTYWLVTSPAGLDHNGFYVDHLRREENTWLISLRRPGTLWIGPQSLLRASP